ncbi:MAG: Rrf2 family transcriptional regulator [Candidatus Atribacteria bacterium]|nr:Rrf2 family transcriptional regulator [Candidatus Atribacteria bacterium]
MKGIVNLSEASILALHSMVLLAQNESEPLTIKQMAEKTASSEAHLSKVMQRLAKIKLVDSIRGPNGGFHLKHPIELITLLDIYQAIEGPLEEESCFSKSGKCPFKKCLFGGLINKMRQEFQQYLASKTLKDLVETAQSSQ